MCEEQIKQTGLRIRYLRQLRGMTIEDLAEVADIHPVYLGAVERGVRNPSLRNLVKIAEGLETDLRDIFGEPIAELDKEKSVEFARLYDRLRDNSADELRTLVRAIEYLVEWKTMSRDHK
jgi:transcriptional regulator with XRE-family HTH domain